jgi:hypothetical protein
LCISAALLIILPFVRILSTAGAFLTLSFERSLLLITAGIPFTARAFLMIPLPSLLLYLLPCPSLSTGCEFPMLPLPFPLVCSSWSFVRILSTAREFLTLPLSLSCSLNALSFVLCPHRFHSWYASDVSLGGISAVLLITFSLAGILSTAGVFLSFPL